jgi:hypothetical protein
MPCNKQYRHIFSADQRFETLSKPKVVVKRAVAQAAVEKPKEPTPPAIVADSVVSVTPSETRTIPKASTQVTATSKDDTKSGAAAVQFQKSHTQQTSEQQREQEKDDSSRKNVWEQRKEQFENKQDSTASKESRQKDDQYGKDFSEEASGDEHGFEDWRELSGRGRGTARGRVRREFVSSRRLHGHSLGGSGSAIKRGGHRSGSSNWEGGPTFARRRGGSAGHDQPKSRQEEKENVEKPSETPTEETAQTTSAKKASNGESEAKENAEKKQDDLRLVSIYAMLCLCQGS